ncbi:MAG TPA: hypothetical protein DDY52_00410 [Candidatus Moranbacteria bacterium]|nr:hypothetical protein [Candidatus Moranbacteria bacterium]
MLAHYVKKKGILSWEKAIYKMSGAPAERFGIEKRGVIKVGNHADIVILDPETVNDIATINKPYQYPVGINYVLVNGKIALEEGLFVDAKNGSVILKGRY